MSFVVPQNVFHVSRPLIRIANRFVFLLLAHVGFLSAEIQQRAVSDWSRSHSEPAAEELKGSFCRLSRRGRWMAFIRKRVGASSVRSFVYYIHWILSHTVLRRSVVHIRMADISDCLALPLIRSCSLYFLLLYQSILNLAVLFF